MVGKEGGGHSEATRVVMPSPLSGKGKIKRGGGRGVRAGGEKRGEGWWWGGGGGVGGSPR